MLLPLRTPVRAASFLILGSAMVEHADAHFQHPAKPLEALLSPPVPDPRAMAWSGEELLVADREGQIHLVEPSFGARRLFMAARDPVRIAISPLGAAGRRVAVVDHLGRLRVYELDGRLVWEQSTGLLAGVQILFTPPGVVVVGDAPETRRIWLFSPDGTVVGRARLPARTIALPRGKDLFLVRSLAAGLQVRPFGEQLGSEPATEHHLMTSGGFVYGVASGGVTLWRSVATDASAKGGEAVTVKLYDVANAALTVDGETLALATRSGTVSVTVARPGVPRASAGKVGGHEAPITGLAFAPKGRWLASLAEKVWIWSY